MEQPIRDFTNQTLAVWQPNSRRALSPEDARDIADNMVGFFSVLLDWTAAEEAGEDHDDAVSARVESIQ